MHHTPGGLATSWRKGDYTFETCFHWLLGSHPKAPMYSCRCMVSYSSSTFLGKLNSTPNVKFEKPTTGYSVTQDLSVF
jgi:hypothetical protein